MKNIEKADKISHELIDLIKKGKVSSDPNDYPELYDYIRNDPRYPNLKSTLESPAMI